MALLFAAEVNIFCTEITVSLFPFFHKFTTQFMQTLLAACTYNCSAYCIHQQYRRRCRRCRKWLLLEINDIIPDDDEFIARSFISAFMQWSIYTHSSYYSYTLYTILNEMAPPSYWKLRMYSIHCHAVLVVHFNESRGRKTWSHNINNWRYKPHDRIFDISFGKITSISNH